MDIFDVAMVSMSLRLTAVIVVRVEHVGVDHNTVVVEIDDAAMNRLAR